MRKTAIFFLNRFLLITIIFLGSLIQLPFVEGGWLPGEWDQRVKITIDSGDIDGVLVDFPFLIYISGSSGINNEDVTFIFDEVGANSLKIAVTESDGITECKVEVERWDFGNEKAWLWVKGSSVASDVDTDFYLYYDNDHADNVANVGVVGSASGEAVWDSNFVMVQHLTGAAFGDLDDSTSNDNDVTAQGGTPDYNSVGEIASAVGYVEASSEWNRINNAATLKLLSDYTIEFWIKTAESDTYRPIVEKFDQDNPWQGWGIFFNDVGGVMAIKDDASWLASTVAINNNVWRYIVITNDDINTRIFIDNVARGVAASGNPEDYTGPLHFATHEKENVFSDLILDDVRLSKIERNAAWRKACYESGRDDLLDFGKNVKPPSEPNLLFGAGFNSSSPYVELHWDHSLENVQFFEIQNSTDKISWDYLDNSTTANYTDNQVFNGTARFYRVRACNFTDGVWYNSSFSEIDFEIVYFLPPIGGIENGITIIESDAPWIALAIILSIIALLLAWGYKR